jgi:uncharacterized protein YjbI with pentapeptide repeats
MNTQSQKIIKRHQPVSLEKSTPIRNSLVKNIEILRTVMRSAEIPKNLTASIVMAIVSVAVICLLFLVNIANTNSSFNLSSTTNSHRQAVLNDYLQTMTGILLEENPREINQKSTLFRAITQATLQELDPERKRYVIMFLHDANLLKISSKKQASLLLGANLEKANLQNLNLSSTDLRGANLRAADFRDTDLRGAILNSAKLTNSCYNNGTFFDKRFKPIAAGMRTVKESEGCS